MKKLFIAIVIVGLAVVARAGDGCCKMKDTAACPAKDKAACPIKDKTACPAMVNTNCPMKSAGDSAKTETPQKSEAGSQPAEKTAP